MSLSLLCRKFGTAKNHEHDGVKLFSSNLFRVKNVTFRKFDYGVKPIVYVIRSSQLSQGELTTQQISRSKYYYMVLTTTNK